MIKKILNYFEKKTQKFVAVTFFVFPVNREPDPEFLSDEVTSTHTHTQILGWPLKVTELKLSLLEDFFSVYLEENIVSLKILSSIAPFHYHPTRSI